MATYSLSNYSNIIKMEEFSYELPPSLVTNINNICTTLNLNQKITQTEYVNVPTEENPFKNLVSVVNSQSKKEKEDKRTSLDKIKLYLNQLSNTNYVDLRVKIMDELHSVEAVENEQNENEQNENEQNIKNKISETIFNLSSSNMFYSAIFAELYSDLIYEFDWLEPYYKQVFTSLHDYYVKDMKNYNQTGVSDSYDTMCDLKKLKDKRKAFTMFLWQLCICKGINNGLIDLPTVTDLLYYLLQWVHEIILNNEDISRKYMVEELVEDIFILYTEIHKHGTFLEKWDIDIAPLVIQMASYKTKDYVNLSNKVLFKFKDLKDKKF